MAPREEVHCVTGAFGLTGRFVAARLLALDRQRQQQQEQQEQRRHDPGADSDADAHDDADADDGVLLPRIRVRTLTNSGARAGAAGAGEGAEGHENWDAEFIRAEGAPGSASSASTSSSASDADDGATTTRLPPDDTAGVPLAANVEVRPLDFSDEGALTESLRGVSVLYNTYWVRFDHNAEKAAQVASAAKKKEAAAAAAAAAAGAGGDGAGAVASEPAFSYGQAVENTLVLFRAAKAAGVRRIVHVSIMGVERSDLPYFAGKRHLEAALGSLGVPEFAILRPSVIFGAEDILVNNIAWTLRNFPLTLIPTGDYGVQPIHVADFAELLVDYGTADAALGDPATAIRARLPADVLACGPDLNTDAHRAGEGFAYAHDAVGPESYSFWELNQLIAGIVGRRNPLIIPAPHGLMYMISLLLGALVRDQILTRGEITGLTDGLLAAPAAHINAPTRLSTWARARRDTLGARYASELARRRDRASAYKALYQRDTALGSGHTVVALTLGVFLAATAVLARAAGWI